MAKGIVGDFQHLLTDDRIGIPVPGVLDQVRHEAILFPASQEFGDGLAGDIQACLASQQGLLFQAGVEVFGQVQAQRTHVLVLVSHFVIQYQLRHAERT